MAIEPDFVSLQDFWRERQRPRRIDGVLEDYRFARIRIPAPAAFNTLADIGKRVADEAER
jgi:hypothetical protein